VLPTLSSGHVVVTDPPYGVTDHAWDVVVDPCSWMFDDAIVTATEPYATALIGTAPISFKYDMVWVKNTATNAFNAHRMPMRAHERVLVFGDPCYTPVRRRRSAGEMKRLNYEQRAAYEWASPDSVLWFDAVNNRSSRRSGHPSQKPVELFVWLVNSYGRDRPVLDPFMGSGTTLVAAACSGRSAIGIEIEERYCEIAAKRLGQEVLPLEVTA
jgi:site-specific DNA-methyltransferase (adenine-specific)